MSSELTFEFHHADFFGIASGKSIGSGTIINKDGTILTCAHLVVDFMGTRGSTKGKVCLHASFHDAK